MLASSIPVKFPIPWGNSATSGYIRPIPVASQILITPGAASLTDGFPPLNLTPESSGGIPPFGQDENGILNQITAWSRWQNAGGPVQYDSTFSTSIGGYPQGALLTAASGVAYWVSTADNNTTNPDAGGAGWQAVAYGTTYAGNPNGHVAGIASTVNGLTQSFLWDTTNKVLWLCVTTGSTSTAVWVQIGGFTAVNQYCVDTGTANAYVIALAPALSAYTNGFPFKFRAVHPNTGACTINAGPGVVSLLRSDGSALQLGDIFANDLLTATYDTTTGAALLNGLVQSQLRAIYGALSGGNQWQGGQGSTPLPVAYASTITLNFSLANNFVLGTVSGGVITGGITGNFILANPTITSANYGQSGAISVIQDATGGRTITSFGTAWLPSSGVLPNLTGTANKRDNLWYYVNYDGTISVSARNNEG